MPKRRGNHALFDKAKANKKDEFYTLYKDIERELKYYQHCFAGKTVYCNTDDPRKSSFFRYFADNFKALGLKKLICSCYSGAGADSKLSRGAFCYVYTGKEDPHPALEDLTPLQGDGDFRSAECLALLEEADAVVTNPPFSLFREFVALLVSHHKQFLLISNINAITYKEIFKLIQDSKAWLGVNLGRGISGFEVPGDYELYGLEARIDELGRRIVASNNCMWLTNLDHKARHELLPLSKTYSGNEELYPRYDNYDAINVNRTADIPNDYAGAMGVPITFLNKFNPEQFEIIKFRKGDDEKDLRINGKPPYFRILIKPRHVLSEKLSA